MGLKKCIVGVNVIVPSFAEKKQKTKNKKIGLTMWLDLVYSLLIDYYIFPTLCWDVWLLQSEWQVLCPS